jgi:hypothetical protein
MKTGRTLWIIAVVLVALTMGLTFAHVLEMPVKLGYDADMYRQVNGSLYAYFAYVGGPVEVAAVVVAALAAWSRRGRAGFRSWTAGAIGTAAALAVWAAVVQPANVEFGRWSAAIPGDWERWRAQWEAGHAASFALLLVALVLLLISPGGGAARGRSAGTRAAA